MKLSGLQFPSNLTKVYSEDWSYEQESKENEILNRDFDLFESGIIRGGEITVGAEANSINFPEITVAYNSEGQRIFVPVVANFVLPANSSFTLVLRHKFINDVVTNPDGGVVTYKVNSYEILFRTGSIQAGDIPIRLITTSAGVVTLGDDLRVWRRIPTDRIADNSISLAKQNTAVKTGLLTDISGSILSGVTGDLSFAKAINQFFSIFKRDKKELGEVFFMSELKAASSDFPAICLALNNAVIWKSGNPLGAGNIPGNFLELVDYLRAIPLRFDPLNANNTDFTVASWGYSAGEITLTFAFTTPMGTKESKLLRSLHEDAFVHNDNDSIGVEYSAFVAVSNWRTITLVDPLRDDTDAIQVPAGTYQITAIAGGESAAGQIMFVHSGTPSGTPKIESRLVRFYPYRIQDSGQNLDVNATLKARHFAIQGRGFVTVDNADSSEWVGGLRRRDRLQGFEIKYQTPLGSGYPFAVGSTYASEIRSSLPESDGVNGVPRIANTTDARGAGCYPYIWAKSFS